MYSDKLASFIELKVVVKFKEEKKTTRRQFERFEEICAFARGSNSGLLTTFKSIFKRQFDVKAIGHRGVCQTSQEPVGACPEGPRSRLA